MTRRICGILTLVCCLAALPLDAAETRNKIVLFLIDALGWRDLGCQESN